MTEDLFHPLTSKFLIN